VGALPEHHAWSPLQDEHSKLFRNTFEESCGISTHHTNSNKVVMLHPAEGSREVTSSGGKESLSDVAIHSAKEGIKGGKKRCKQHPQGTTTTTDHNNGNDGEASGSSVRCILIAAHSDKRQPRPPMHHYKRPLEEACPNHAYPVRHKLKDCGMMRIFMILGSLTWGVELDEDMGGDDMMLFPMENAVMTVYGGCPD
jgi:hypothetical protein